MVCRYIHSPLLSSQSKSTTEYHKITFYGTNMFTSHTTCTYRCRKSLWLILNEPSSFPAMKFDTCSLNYNCDKFGRVTFHQASSFPQPTNCRPFYFPPLICLPARAFSSAKQMATSLIVHQIEEADAQCAFVIIIRKTKRSFLRVTLELCRPPTFVRLPIDI